MLVKNNISSKMNDSKWYKSLKIESNSNQYDGYQIIDIKIYKKVYSTNKMAVKNTVCVLIRVSDKYAISDLMIFNYSSNRSNMLSEFSCALFKRILQELNI